MLQRTPTVSVLFDEAHSEAWTIRPEVARQIQPSHPEDSSYALAAAALAAHEMAVDAHTEGPLDHAALAAADVLVLAHPSDPAWERVVPGGSPQLSAAELDLIEGWVREGGGLVILGETEQAKYGTNLGALAERFGIALENETVSDYGSFDRSPHWVRAELGRGDRGGVDLLARVRDAVFYRSTTLQLFNGATPLARAGAGSSAPGAPLLAVTEHGAGRVVVLGDSDLFGDDCLGEHSHADLWLNLVTWAAGAAFASAEDAAQSALAADPAWPVLRDAVDRLRGLQEPDGCARDAAADGPALAAEVATVVEAIAALGGHVPHQEAYVAAVQDDLRAWAGGGFGVPDFTDSLEAFRPDLVRRDGIEHLVVFPMDKQNGPRGKLFEALVVRVPWPAWLAELEAGPYDNAKFVPVELVDHTAGYDSECAVLFPETVAVQGKPANHFGGIFRDREAERFRRTCGEAARTLRLNLPPDAAALLSSEALSKDAYLLWDLVHDRTHSHGDLPFDPFMIRQRMPYWMYALEELRCDLTAYSEAVRLESEGFAFARHVQYAILFDRLFRFPVTGARVRNYDGLGGQLLFAFLHRTGRLHWTDNRLTIEWERVADGVLELRAAVEELYRAGIDRTKVAHWGAAHDLVASYVTPASGSRWVRGVRAFPDAEDPRPFIDEVLPDEFPLSIFYASLRQKLAPVLERRPSRAAVAA